MTEPTARGDHSRAALARRIQLLQDFAEVMTGAPFSYAELIGALSVRDLSLRPSEWSQLVGGASGELPPGEVFAGLAGVFGVSASFLLEGGALPPALEAVTGPILSLRANRIRELADRHLVDLAPNVLDDVIAALAPLAPLRS
ncbi:hypothetical protein ASF88_00830 [Leifsonia sp. Leaf336]|uniref:hypothetical protein n=1 Tax=Leifsonia sp. Leaf336 TaxID=1736341 RepID=UPI0006F4D4CE|nr:hypothetical protein [Leifsonia sp. Leaf336]KQR53467.1 hypothetical protein ASF88_00830 [Leifsonia sp. Leaf336]